MRRLFFLYNVVLYWFFRNFTSCTPILLTFPPSYPPLTTSFPSLPEKVLLPHPTPQKKQSTQSQPALHWPWDSWPCPLLKTTAGELALPLMGELTPALRKDGHSHPRLGRASSTLTLHEGGNSRGPDWPVQLPPWALAWPTLTSTPSMTCWIMLRDWSYGTIATGSPWLGRISKRSFDEGPVMLGQRPWTRPMTHCSEDAVTPHSSQCY